MSSINTYPRETVEFQPILVKADGEPVTTDVEACVLAFGLRPEDTDWAAAVTLEGQIGVMIEDLSPGNWTVWVRVTSYPEVPVISVGPIMVT